MLPLNQDEIRETVNVFLRDFKGLMQEGRYFVKPHQKNLQTLIVLGITYKIRNDTVLALKVSDYSSGPNMDEYGKADYWVFGKEINKIEIYIKLQLFTYPDGNERAGCISFHIAERPLKYPFNTA